MPHNTNPKFTTEIKVSGTDSLDAQRRLNALIMAEQHLDTDVLEILARKSSKKGINDKVRQMQYLI